ncbi:hypothetical protein JCM16303_000638 [Sporobolomyces ruberrimus]
MLVGRLLAGILALAPLALAQSDSESDSGLFGDFPAQCSDTCTAMESIAQNCTTMGESIEEEAAIACVCNSTFVKTLEDCGNCVIPAAGIQSESGNVIVQLAISFSKTCETPIKIDGITDPSLSSFLASPSATASSPPGSSTSSIAPSEESMTSVTDAPSSVTSSGSPSSTSTNPSSSSSPSSPPGNGAGTVGYSALASSLALVIVGLLVSTPRQQIPNTGSLADRIAKLNLAPTSSPSSSPSTHSTSRPSSPTTERTGPVKTGSTQKISDRISRFQVNAEENPLLPSGGSFGLAPARPSGFKDRGGEKGRVASLGAGRAPVPLNVVKPTARSASAGSLSNARTASEDGSVGSGHAEARTGSVGSGGGGESRPATPAGTRTGTTDQSSSAPLNDVVPTSTTSTPEGLDVKGFSNLLAPDGPRTPGAMSVSSMNVETGSIASEGERNPSENDFASTLATSDTFDPSDVASLDPQPGDSAQDLAASSSSIASSDDAPPTPPALHIRHPLEHLREPSRSGSIASMSSLLVEAPPEDTADLDAISNSGRSVTASREGARSVVTSTPQDDGVGEEEGDERRLERTNEELTKFENDEEDPTAYGPGTQDGGNGGLPVRPTWEADDENAGMPKAKCSDCDAEVDLVELADHTCASSRQTSSVTSPPVSPANPRIPLPSASPSQDEQALSDEPLDTPLDDVSATPLAGSAILPPPPPEETSEPTRSVEPTPDEPYKLDDYVPQTQSVVPEDMDDDLLDFYGDEPVSSPADQQSAAVPTDADVPLDPGEDDVHDVTPSSLMSRSHSQPTARAPKDQASGPRSHSVYLPGHYDDEDEDGYQGGTVTIVRSSR